MIPTLFQELVETGVQTMGAVRTYRSGYDWTMETPAGRYNFSIWPDAVVGFFPKLEQAKIALGDYSNFGKSTGKFNFHYFCPGDREAAHVLGVLKNIKVV